MRAPCGRLIPQRLREKRAPVTLLRDAPRASRQEGLIKPPTRSFDAETGAAVIRLGKSKQPGKNTKAGATCLDHFQHGSRRPCGTWTEHLKGTRASQQRLGSKRWRIWSTNRSSRPSKPRAGEWLLLGEHLLLHAAPLMWLNDRTIVVLQDRSPRARCQDPTRREDAAWRRPEQRGTATATTPRSSKALGAPCVGVNFLLAQEQ